MGQGLQIRRKHNICNSIGHIMTSEVITQPTCTSTGVTRHYCTRPRCKYSYTTNTPAALGHNTSSPKVYGTVSTSCASNGKTCTASRAWTQPCTRCSTNLNSGTETATATVTSAVKIAATCTTKGTTTYTHKFSESWAPAQHTKDVQDIAITSCASWQTPTYSWASNGSTCTATRKCNLNAHTQTSNATVTSAVKTQANCTTKGTTRYTATFSDSWATTQTKDIQDIAIDSSNHSWSVSYSWASDGSSCTATRSCGRSSSHNVTANATITSSVTTAATCTTWGKTTYTATFSGATWATKQTKVIQDVPALDHSWSVSYSWASNGSSCTATRKCSRDSTHNLTSTATITSAVKTAATCTTKGTTTYTAKFSDSWASTQTKDIQDIAINASNHTSAKTKATATSTPARASNVCWIYPCCKTVADSTHTSSYGGTSGVHTKCSDCGYVISTSHTYNQTNTSSTYRKSAANCMSPAIYYKSCVCGYARKNSADEFTSGSKDASNHITGCTIVYGGTSGVHQKYSQCGATYSTTHTYNQSTATSTYLKSAANCLSPAVYYKSCACGYSNKSTTFTSGSKNANNHASTCTIVYGGTSGVHQKYSGCGATYSTTHTYNQSNTSSTYLKSAANCMSPAIYYKSCACGYARKTSADEFTSGSKAPNNHISGCTVVYGGTEDAHQKYSKCGKIYSSSHSMNLTDWDDGNCQNLGYETYTCSCGYSYTNWNDSYGDHELDYDSATSYGWLRHRVTCKYCSYATYEDCTSECAESEWEWQNDTTHIFTCSVCGYTYEDSHSWEDCWCTVCNMHCDCLYGDFASSEEHSGCGTTNVYCSTCGAFKYEYDCELSDSMGDGEHYLVCWECDYYSYCGPVCMDCYDDGEIWCENCGYTWYV